MTLNAVTYGLLVPVTNRYPVSQPGPRDNAGEARAAPVEQGSAAGGPLVERRENEYVRTVSAAWLDTPADLPARGHRAAQLYHQVRFAEERDYLEEFMGVDLYA